LDKTKILKFLHQPLRKHYIKLKIEIQQLTLLILRLPQDVLLSDYYTEKPIISLINSTTVIIS